MVLFPEKISLHILQQYTQTQTGISYQGIQFVNLTICRIIFNCFSSYLKLSANYEMIIIMHMFCHKNSVIVQVKLVLSILIKMSEMLATSKMPDQCAKI